MSFYQPDDNDPVDNLAWYLSELHNDNAPIGWHYYRPMAKSLIEKFNLANEVMKQGFLL